MARAFADIVNAAWDDAMRTTEDPFRRDVRSSPFADLLGVKPYSYREELDRVKRNHFGQPIPRIEIVRQNLAAFKAGNTRTWRGLDVKDRRESRGRRRSDGAR